MDIGNVHHLGYLVKNISKSISAFQALGYKVEKDIYYDNERKADFCFLTKQKDRVELVEPNKESDIYPLLKKYNNTIYHVCYQVNDLDKVIESLRRKSFLLFRDRQMAPAISDNAVVVFMMHARLGIIELLEER